MAQRGLDTLADLGDSHVILAFCIRAQVDGAQNSPGNSCLRRRVRDRRTQASADVSQVR